MVSRSQAYLVVVVDADMLPESSNAVIRQFFRQMLYCVSIHVGQSEERPIFSRQAACRTPDPWS